MVFNRVAGLIATPASALRNVDHADHVDHVDHFNMSDHGTLIAELDDDDDFCDLRNVHDSLSHCAPMQGVEKTLEEAASTIPETDDDDHDVGCLDELDVGMGAAQSALLAARESAERYAAAAKASADELEARRVRTKRPRAERTRQATPEDLEGLEYSVRRCFQEISQWPDWKRPMGLPPMEVSFEGWAVEFVQRIHDARREDVYARPPASWQTRRLESVITVALAMWRKNAESLSLRWL